jgi:ribosomal protein S18 acetylase RimI-like enzyme
MSERYEPYPTDFTKCIEMVEPAELEPVNRFAAAQLLEKGYRLSVGVRGIDVPEIGRIARQAGVMEYCPGDAEDRFTSAMAMRTWMQKKEGRGMVLLRSQEQCRVVGYGWVGPGRSRELPGCTTTFAVRLDEAVAGQGLGRLFTAGIVAVARRRYGATNIGLETWATNGAAVNSYRKAGAQFVHIGREELRPTLDSRYESRGGQRPDHRISMMFKHFIHG